MYTVVNDIRRSFAFLSALFITVAVSVGGVPERVSLTQSEVLIVSRFGPASVFTAAHPDNPAETAQAPLHVDEDNCQVITSKVKGHEHCTPQELMNCAKPLSVLTDSGLTFVSSQADLYKICPDLKEAIRCIHAYTRHCMNIEHRRHFKKLFHGTGLMVHELCKNGTYQEEYLKHAPCMKEVEKENEVCFKRYTKAMNEIQSNTPELNSSEPDIVSVLKKKREAADEGIKNVCCSFQEYVECSTHTVRRRCGDEAAEFSRRFMDKMSSSMIQLHCTEYGRRECGLIAASSRIENSALAVIVLSVLALLWR